MARIPVLSLILLTILCIFLGVSYADEKDRCKANLQELLEVPSYAWKHQMLDAYGKLGSGSFQWNQNLWWGQYDECNYVSVAPYTKYDKPAPYGGFTGKYCVAVGNISFGIEKIRIGICVPDVCTSEDLTANKPVLKEILKRHSLLHEDVKDFWPVSINCEDDYQFHWVNPFTVLFTAVCLVVTWAWFYDWQFDPNKQELPTTIDLKNYLTSDSNNNRTVGGQILLCFSPRRNLSKLMKESSSDHIECLNGLRVLSMVSIFYYHLYDAYAMENSFSDTQKSFGKSLTVVAIANIHNSYLSVETFFVISGFLVGHKFPKQIFGGGWRVCGFQILLFYFIRYIRLAPSLVLISFYGHLFPGITRGPVSILNMPHLMDDAKRRWLWNLLFISNYFPQSTTDWTWYLTMDFQFYLLSPFLLILIQRKFKVGCSVAAVVVVFSCAMRWMITNSFFTDQELAKLPVQLAFVENGAVLDLRLNFAWNMMYDNPLCRVGSYVVGLVTGTLISSGRTTLRYKHLRAGWIVAILTGISVTTFFSYADGNSYLLTACSNYGLRPTMWAFVIAWIIYTSYNHNGGRIGAFLSLKIWSLPSRLVYSIYLVHVIIIIWYLANETTSLGWSNTVWNVTCIGLMPLVLLTALLLHIFVELPAILIGNIFVRKFVS